MSAAIWGVVLGVALLWFIFMPLLRVINPMRVNATGDHLTGKRRDPWDEEDSTDS